MRIDELEAPMSKAVYAIARELNQTAGLMTEHPRWGEIPIELFVVRQGMVGPTGPGQDYKYYIMRAK